MTVVTGIVDAVSFLALGRVFTANMTGNLVLIGFAFAGAPGISISRSAVALLAFLSGAVLGGGVASEESSWHRWADGAFMLEALLLGVAAVTAAGTRFNCGTAIHCNCMPSSSQLGVAMGLRNAIVQKACGSGYDDYSVDVDDHRAGCRFQVWPAEIIRGGNAVVPPFWR